jgi:cob(I)alamin adenosyltransferase
VVAAVKIYTRKGDDGTTGLLFGGRVRKDAPAPSAYGDVDEAQAVLGVARAECEPGTELDELLIHLERDLWVVMAELATAPENREKLQPGTSLVTDAMVAALEPVIDDITGRFNPPTEFVVPGQNRTAALLDLARTVVRRAERSCLAIAVEGSHAIAYLNRLSDLLWTLARWQEEHSLPTRERT